MYVFILQLYLYVYSFPLLQTTTMLFAISICFFFLFVIWIQFTLGGGIFCTFLYSAHRDSFCHSWVEISWSSLSVHLLDWPIQSFRGENKPACVMSIYSCSYVRSQLQWHYCFTDAALRNTWNRAKLIRSASIWNILYTSFIGVHHQTAFGQTVAYHEYKLQVIQKRLDNPRKRSFS